MPPIKKLLASFSIREKSKCYISIGDDGIIFIIFVKNKPVCRYFAKDIASEEFAKIKQELTSYPGIPIYFILDNIDQSYTLESTPATSASNAKQIMQRKIKKIGRDEDVKTFTFLRKNKDGKRVNWEYLMISAQINIAESIMQEICNISNNFMGFISLPTEMINLHKKILSKNNRKCDSSKSQWAVIILHNKISGFRQIVIKDNNVIFARLISNTKDVLPDVIAGSIQQEYQNTMQYIQRLEYEASNSEMTLQVVVSSEIKNSLQNIKFDVTAFDIFTPYEISEMYNMKNLVKEEDKFADAICVCAINNVHNTLMLHNNKTKHNIHIKYTRIALVLTSFMALIIAIMMISWSGISIAQSINAVHEKSVEITHMKQELQEKQYKLDQIDKNILQIVNAYKVIEYNKPNALDHAKNLIELNTESMNIYRYNWRIDGNQYHILLDINLENIKSYNDAINAYNKLKDDLKNAFKDGDIEISELPGTMDMSTEQNIPIKINIKGRL